MSESEKLIQPKVPRLGLIIVRDLFTAGRVPLFLLITVFFTAITVVLTTHMTRQVISQKDQELEQREQLDEEWRNLILEENALSEHSRVQKIATSDLEMKRPDSDKEVIVKL
ncbi:cell division protein FtsL [Vibrio sp. UCD-FRSSP16_10]|uniref:cell division protein FtsL n=1 Tax=unclassified Vibrio TaxID=2614977 RepID=UPI00080070F6|nr:MULTISPECIES: cell division protein FtsL [unclassified Vibrio]OBT07346.1 cell division protein FtsL [Vibrio sp. UCD-FRSSP16_30]OBT12825.1 cell division protein FtsL [Vibrio sp. UCD-FRSSP16_10]